MITLYHVLLFMGNTSYMASLVGKLSGSHKVRQYLKTLTNLPT